MKKGLSLFTLAFALLFGMSVKANALIQTQQDLQDCIDTAATATDKKATCVVSSYINLESTIEIKDGVEVTISLDKTGGALEITADDSVDPLFKVTNGKLIIDGAGRITGNVDVFYLKPVDDDAKAELVIGEDVEVVSNTSNAVYLRGKGAKVDIYGDLLSNSTGYAAVQGNGSAGAGGTVINVYEGASIKAPSNTAIYHPQDGELTVYGGEITGTTGIEMRAGKLTVKGGTIIGTAVPTTTKENGNGSTTEGAGIAIVQHTTELNLVADVSGGTIKGYTALYHNNTENNSDEAAAKVTLDVTGGTFEATNEGKNAIYSDAKENFITGGEFKGEVDEKFVSEDLETKVIDGVTYIGESIPKTPETGDNVMLFVILGLMSLVAFGFAANKLRKNA